MIRTGWAQLFFFRYGLKVLPVLGRLKGLFLFSLVFTAVLVSGCFSTQSVWAHSPHDIIDALDISPTFNHDKTLFIAIEDQLLKSEDGGFSWKKLINGLDNENIFSCITISPSFQADRAVFVSSRGDGIYRSQDGGFSWSRVNNGLHNLNIELLSALPVDATTNILMAAGSEGGLYKTSNGGESWYQVMGDDIKITAIVSCHYPKKGHVLAGDLKGNIYLSTDYAETWQKHLQIPKGSAISAIAILPKVLSHDTVIVGTKKDGVFKTVDGGASFIEINEGITDKRIVSLAISPEYDTDKTIFASAWKAAVFCSSDGGNTWKKNSQGITWHWQADEPQWLSPHFRGVKISNAFSQDKTLFMGGFDGLFKSTDGGQVWTEMETLSLRLIKGLALSPGDKDHSTVAITTYGGGAYTTKDRGTTWTVNNKGVSSARLSDIVFSPNYGIDHTMFTASREFLLKSTDEGRSWERYSLKYESWRTRLNLLIRKLRFPGSLIRAFHKNVMTPFEKERPFITKIALSPDFASSQVMYFGTRRHGILKSIHGGPKSKPVWEEEWGRPITALAISPVYPSDKTLFAGISGAGVYKTTDGGDTWQSVNNGFKFIDAWQKVAVKDLIEKEFVELAISPNYEIDQTVYAGFSEGLYKTTDGGSIWKPLNVTTDEEDGHIIGMAISPDYAQDHTLIVSLKGRGLYETMDEGITFQEIAPALITNGYDIELIKFSEAYSLDKTIYAASDEELFQSFDGGRTWMIIKRPIRYENIRVVKDTGSPGVIKYEGEWLVTRGDDYSGTSVSHSVIAHNSAALDFVGTGVTWIGTTSSDQGIGKVYIDGNHTSDVDQFSNTRNFMVNSYSIRDLEYGPHNITIEVTDSKNPNSSGHRIEIDAFDVMP